MWCFYCSSLTPSSHHQAARIWSVLSSLQTREIVPPIIFSHCSKAWMSTTLPPFLLVRTAIQSYPLQARIKRTIAMNSELPTIPPHNAPLRMLQCWTGCLFLVQSWFDLATASCKKTIHTESPEVVKKPISFYHRRCEDFLLTLWSATSIWLCCLMSLLLWREA